MTRVHLVSSSGGHLELLIALREAFAAYDRVWLTTASPRADELRREGESVHRLPAWDQHALGLRRVLHGCRVAARLRPRLVITSGAGVAVPFCLTARLFGARIVFVETMARTSTASLSGRVLSRLAKRVLVQWPQMTAVYPGSVACRPALLEDVAVGPLGEGVGALVAVGTHSSPFDRILTMVDEAVLSGLLAGPICAQAGASTYSPQCFATRPFLTPDALAEAVAQHRVIVCHTGSGIVSLALRSGRRPLVVPRRRDLGEHVDDHQVDVAERLAALGLVVHVEGEITAEHLAAAARPLEVPAQLSESPRMVDELRRAVDELGA